METTSKTKLTINKREVFREDMQDFLEFTGLPKEDPRRLQIDMARYYEGSLEHYPLLRYISNRIDNCKIMDGGTYNGLSSAALSRNQTNDVHSYDIKDLRTSVNYLESIPNTTYHLKSILDLSDEELNSFDFIFIDVDPHDGIQELEFTNRLLAIDYKGFMFADDIHLSIPMNSWWRSLPGYKKYDLTRVGHNSGSGIWVPDGSRFEIEIIDE